MYLRPIGRVLLAILLLPIRLVRAIFFAFHALTYSLCRLLGSRAARWVWFLALLAGFTQTIGGARLSLENFFYLTLCGFGVSYLAAVLRDTIGRPVLPRRPPRRRKRKPQTILPSHVQVVVPGLPRAAKRCNWAPVLEELVAAAVQRQARQITV